MHVRNIKHVIDTKHFSFGEQSSVFPRDIKVHLNIDALSMDGLIPNSDLSAIEDTDDSTRPARHMTPNHQIDVHETNRSVVLKRKENLNSIREKVSDNIENVDEERKYAVRTKNPVRYLR